MDHVHDLKNNTGILFIDSTLIIDELARIADVNSKIEDVYDFYQAQVRKDGLSTGRFTKDLLQLSVDNGALLVVLDGIDEVIAKLGSRFDVSAFISSISTGYSGVLNKAKILITCRDHFWDMVGRDVSLPEITLIPFNRTLAIEFFKQTFKGDQSKVSKAIAVADKFATEHMEPTAEPNEEAIYIPYALDTISYLINKDGDLKEWDKGRDSTILSTKLQTDFIIASLCEREIKKLHSLGIDDQVRFFMEMAVQKGGTVSLYDVKQVLSSATKMDVDESLIEKIKDHPLVVFAGNRLCFRYDFLGLYFKAVFLVQFFLRKDAERLDERVVDLLTSYVKYGNSFTESLSKRLLYDDELVLFIVDVIGELKSRVLESGAEHEYKWQCAVSSVFSLLLALKQAANRDTFDMESRTQLLEDVFGSHGQLEGVCIINLFGCGRTKLNFDFRARTLVKCVFDRYEYFWDCPVDEQTRFISSTFRSLEPRSGHNPKVFERTFSSDSDVSGIKHILDFRVEANQGEAHKMKEELTKFFRIFHERGNFYPRKQEQVRSKVFAARLLPALLDMQVVREFSDPKKPTLRQYKISDDFRTIIKFLEQGGPCIELDRLVDGLCRE